MFDVSVVIPSIGRPSLRRAVESALAQSWPVTEIIVVLDADVAVDLPLDSRIIVVKRPGNGSAGARQIGVDMARGDVIALLDDDDEWRDDKLARQLKCAASFEPGPWILSSRSLVVGPWAKDKMWPRRLIRPDEAVYDYLFRRTEILSGETLIQTSTLCFSADVAWAVPWGRHADRVKDEATWLIRVQRRFPDIRIVQLPEVLTTYHAHGESNSRATTDRTDEYIEWGLKYLRCVSRRTLGDYLCTSPVSAAVSAHSLSGVMRALRVAARYGKPGPTAVAYAVIHAVRLLSRRCFSW